MCSNCCESLTCGGHDTSYRSSPTGSRPTKRHATDRGTLRSSDRDERLLCLHSAGCVWSFRNKDRPDSSRYSRPAFVEPEVHKDALALTGKAVMLTFGLLSPNKGFENVIKALPRIRSRHKNVVYVIAGATHPHVRRGRAIDTGTVAGPAREVGSSER